jgi:hypothetical protein
VSSRASGDGSGYVLIGYACVKECPRVSAIFAWLPLVLGSSWVSSLLPAYPERFELFDAQSGRIAGGPLIRK